jgi:RNA polymerase sigma-70 factor (ECF subfamily)
MSKTLHSQSDKDQKERDLISAAKKDPQNFAKLYDRHVSSIYKYLYSRTGKKKLAEDLTADTFLSALEAISRYRNSGSFSAWLFSIARNKLMDHFRQNGKTLSPAEKEYLAADTADNPLDELIQIEVLHQVSEILDTLEDDQLDLLRLRYSAGLKFAEIASQVNKSEDAVKKSFYRLLKRIKTKMEVADVCQ